MSPYMTHLKLGPIVGRSELLATSAQLLAQSRQNQFADRQIIQNSRDALQRSYDCITKANRALKSSICISA